MFINYSAYCTEPPETVRRVMCVSTVRTSRIFCVDLLYTKPCITCSLP